MFSWEYQSALAQVAWSWMLTIVSIHRTVIYDQFAKIRLGHILYELGPLYFYDFCEFYSQWQRLKQFARQGMLPVVLNNDQVYMLQKWNLEELYEQFVDQSLIPRLHFKNPYIWEDVISPSINERSFPALQ